MGSYQKGSIIPRTEFINHGAIVKEHEEGLLVASDRTKQAYDIGIQINADEVLVVDSANPQDVRHRIESWAPLVTQYQRLYGKQPQH